MRSPARMVRILGTALLALGGVARAPCAAAPPDTAGVARFVEAQRRLSRIPGVSLAIVQRDGPILEAGFGQASEDGRPVTADTPFVLGSVTKTLTALAVAQLVDAGRIRFDDPVRRHLPDFALRDGAAGPRITVRHLLTHTSGLSQWSGHDQEAQRHGRFGHIAPVRPPGEAFEYSSLNYIVLGRMVEAVSGLPYGDYVRRHVFEPLEMRSSFTGPAEARDRGLAGGNRYLFGLTLWGGQPAAPGPLVPAGFLVASARDVGHFLAMLLGEGTYRGRRVVSAESVRAMFTPGTGGETGPGMAWGVGRTRIGHAGNTQTFSARVALLPAEGYGVAVLTNVNSGPFLPGSAALLDGVIGALQGGSEEARRPDELIVKGVLLASVVWGLARLFRTARRWARQGLPARLPHAARPRLRLVVEVGLAAAVLVALPRWIGVPLRVLVEYFPDLGLALVLGVATGLARALLQAFLDEGGKGPAVPETLGP